MEIPDEGFHCTAPDTAHSGFPKFSVPLIWLSPSLKIDSFMAKLRNVKRPASMPFVFLRMIDMGIQRESSLHGCGYRA